MNELMVKPNESEFPVNCRDVHAKLESKKDYTNWIKAKIAKYGFVAGMDFTPSWARNTKDEKGRGRPSGEYHCTYDMAKELCLVEGTDKGREVRKYFIDTEKKYQQIVHAELSPLDILENHVKKMRALEASDKQIAAKLVQIDSQVANVDNKVDNLGTTVNQLMMHRRGNDPVPAGTISTKKIRFKYFYGVSEDVIRDFLTERNHPKVPFTFVTPAGSDLPSFAWQEDGLKEQYEYLIMTGDYIKSTDKNWIFSHPLLANNFRVKRDEIPASYKKLIEAKTREL